MIDAVLVSSLRPELFVQNFGQLAPSLVVVFVVLDHDSVFIWGEVVLRWFVVKDEDSLTSLALKIGVNKSSPLDFGLSEFHG
jgi:hypothetical protein